ncbi:MAG: hypothetical protein ACJ763_00690 [Bdellovibrionia bacterium]
MKKIMKISSLLSIALMAVAVSACKTIETPDGKIPAEYVDAAKKYEGTYHGHFEHMAGDLTLKIEGTTPVLTFTDGQGNDIMGKGCGSSIGLMKSVTVSDGDQVAIQDATFQFNPGYCGEGRELQVNVSPRDDGTVINVSAVKGHYEFYVPGQMVCQPGHHGHPVCYETPGHYEIRYRYVFGSFKKSN